MRWEKSAIIFFFHLLDPSFKFLIHWPLRQASKTSKMSYTLKSFLCIFGWILGLNSCFYVSSQDLKKLAQIDYVCNHFENVSSILFTILSKNLNRNYIWQYCCVEKSIKCFNNMWNKMDFPKIIDVYVRIILA